MGYILILEDGTIGLQGVDKENRVKFAKMTNSVLSALLDESRFEGSVDSEDTEEQQDEE